MEHLSVQSLHLSELLHLPEVCFRLSQLKMKSFKSIQFSSCKKSVLGSSKLPSQTKDIIFWNILCSVQMIELIVNSVFCLLLLCSSFCDVKFSVLHSVLSCSFRALRKNQCISKINNPYLFRLVGPMIFLCLEPSYRILRLIVRHCSSRFTSCHARPQASDTKHNKLSGLEVLPVDCNPVEIQSVFHNPLVEFYIAIHVIIRKQVNLIRLVFQLNILHRIESDYCFGDTANRNDCCNTAEKERM